MNEDKYKEIEFLCNDHNLTLVDFGNNPIFPEHNKKQIYVRFICNAHQKYGIQEKSIYDLKRLNRPCKYCNHSMLKETFVEELYDVNPNIEILSEYINSDTTIRCRCKIDGHEWDGHPMALLRGDGCNICWNRRRHNTCVTKTTQDIVNEMSIINPNIEIIGEYNGAHHLIKCRCLIDGKKWDSYVCNLLNQSAGCPECDVRRKRESQSLSVDEINERLESNGVNAKIIDGYINNKSKVKCLCTIHDVEYIASAKTLLYNQSSGCPLCNQSLGETKMIHILNQMGYAIDQQHIFPDCKYINVLRFDGYNVINNIAFEYQGQQHYYPVDFSGKGEKYAQHEFEINIIRDNIKREYCKNNNIILIEVPYWEYDNMESFLYKQLNIN